MTHGRHPSKRVHEIFCNRFKRQDFKLIDSFQTQLDAQTLEILFRDIMYHVYLAYELYQLNSTVLECFHLFKHWFANEEIIWVKDYIDNIEEEFREEERKTLSTHYGYICHCISIFEDTYGFLFDASALLRTKLRKSSLNKPIVYHESLNNT
jgi:hypothetical protein